MTNGAKPTPHHSSYVRARLAYVGFWQAVRICHRAWLGFDDGAPLAKFVE